jgi:6-phosphogluconolactonase
MSFEYINQNSLEYVARKIQTVIAACEKSKESCSVMLTGGRSAERLYHAWAGLSDFNYLSKTTFFFSDERCVSPQSVDSNYALVMRTLFKNGVPPGCEVHRMQAEGQNLISAARRYESLLPDTLDVLLLSVGDDGHIASLFPMSDSLDETIQKVIPITGPKAPYQRLTITPPVIKSAEHTYVLAIGAAKIEIYNQVKSQTEAGVRFPATLVASATWFLGTE